MGNGIAHVFAQMTYKVALIDISQDALKKAQEQGLDLVEISPTVDPPVCKIIDYNKFLYDKKKERKGDES